MVLLVAAKKYFSLLGFRKNLLLRKGKGNLKKLLDINEYWCIITQWKRHKTITVLDYTIKQLLFIRTINPIALVILQNQRKIVLQSNWALDQPNLVLNGFQGHISIANTNFVCTFWKRLLSISIFERALRKILDKSNKASYNIRVEWVWGKRDGTKNETNPLTNHSVCGKTRNNKRYEPKERDR